MAQQNTETRNPYLILGVSSSVNTDKDKKAYRRLGLQLHPDKKEGAAIEKMQNLNWAYSVLN